MEPYGNMNTSNGRNCRNSMNQNGRNFMNQSGSQCSGSRNMPNPANQNCNQCSGPRNMSNPVKQNCNTCSGPQHRGNHSDKDRCTIQENPNRSVEMDCVCKVTTKRDCYRNDPMDRLGDQFPPVMAYVPWQQWGELYDADCALMQGTLFKELNLIFCGVRC